MFGVFENSHFLYPGFLKPHYIVLFLMESPLKRPLFLSSPVVHLQPHRMNFYLAIFFSEQGKILRTSPWYLGGSAEETFVLKVDLSQAKGAIPLE